MPTHLEGTFGVSEETVRKLCRLGVAGGEDEGAATVIVFHDGLSDASLQRFVDQVLGVAGLGGRARGGDGCGAGVVDKGLVGGVAGTARLVIAAELGRSLGEWLAFAKVNTVVELAEILDVWGFRTARLDRTAYVEDLCVSATNEKLREELDVQIWQWHKSCGIGKLVANLEGMVKANVDIGHVEENMDAVIGDVWVLLGQQGVCRAEVDQMHRQGLMLLVLGSSGKVDRNVSTAFVELVRQQGWDCGPGRTRDERCR